MFSKYFGWLDRLPYWLGCIILLLLVSVVLLPTSLISGCLSDAEREEAYSEGWDSGYEEGHSDGYGEGLDEGYSDGYDDGYDEGHDAAYDDAYEEGRMDGYTTGYDDGYGDGYDEGYADGYEIGYGDGELFSPDPETAPYIGNSKSHVVHASDCPSLPSESNRVYFGTIVEAYDLGYRLCSRCFS